MKISYFILACLTTLVLIMPLTVPAEDISKTAYDESETQPLAGAPRVLRAGRLSRARAKTTSDEPESSPRNETPLLLVVVPEALAKAPAARKNILPVGLRSLRFGTQHLDQWTDSAGRISDSLTILDHSLRC